jgi:ABC-type antimicrobial peptide transport system permease subunit
VDPIGRHITDEYPTTRWTFEIIGVVADAKEHLPAEPPRPRFYTNLARPIGTVPTVTFLLRSVGDPASVGTAVRARIASVDSGLPIISLRTLTGQIDRRLLVDRLMAQLAAFFGIVALFMASIGLYGVISYSMNRRKAEIGIRMALGASGRSVIRMVLGEAVAIVAMGAAIGLPCALLAGRLVSSRLFGLTPVDPLAMVVAVSLILATAMIAAYLPAQTASRIDPIVSLKCD